MEQVLGVRPTAIPSTPDWWIERIHPEDLSRVMRAAKKAFRSDASGYVHEYRIRHQQGHYIYICDRGRIIRDQTGRAVRVLGGVSDITDLKRSQEALHTSEERFRLATEALAGFVFDWAPISDQLAYFGGLEEVLGFRPNEVPREGAWWRARIHPEDASKAQQAREAAVKGTARTWAVEYRVQHRDGHYVDVVSRGRVVFDLTGRAVRVVGGVYDVSERRRLEREREALLERERKARAAAEAAAHERDAVLGIVSHDLGTPLSTIAMCATALGDQDQPSEDRRKAVDLIGRAVTYMHHMIRDLSDVASIEAGRLALDLRDEDPASIVAEVVEMLGGAASNRGVALETKISAGLPAIRADGARVLQGLANLVTNAVQFTERGAAVTLRAERYEASVRFTVEDPGLGISAEDLPHVFDRYWQKHRGASRHGSGLGLPITRGIVEAHGGQLVAESTPGQGSQFSFTIPIAT
jgi:PAS domain S-box-containing protein